ncbi:HMG box domain-containing protein [Favolaschia claudopus]|uniref:HMG box domain-containing protein n=1 Tax=Favolaschia claudopus TaxID=2862362 RepID=A0AAW0A9R5_9AGAR
MPVERSRGSRRTCADGNRLVWTNSLVPPGNAFATNLTPTAWEQSKSTMSHVEAERVKSAAGRTFVFFDAPPPTDSKSKRITHKRKVTPPLSIAPNTQPQPQTQPQTQTRIPRPPNTFILFRSFFIRAREVPADVEPSHASLSAIAGLTWAALPASEKAAWHRKAKEERERHRERFPGYMSASDSNTDDRGRYVGWGNREGASAAVVARPRRRRQREVAPPDRIRQAHIAGVELREAMEKFDGERKKQGRLEAAEPATCEQLQQEGSQSPVVRRKCRNKKRRLSERRTPPAIVALDSHSCRGISSHVWVRLRLRPAVVRSCNSPPTTTSFPRWSFPSTCCRLFLQLPPTTNSHLRLSGRPLPRSRLPPPASVLCTPLSPAFPHTAALPPTSSFWSSFEDLSLINPFPQPYSVGTHTRQPSPVLACSSISSIGGDPTALTAPPEWIDLSCLSMYGVLIKLDLQFGLPMSGIGWHRDGHG